MNKNIYHQILATGVILMAVGFFGAYPIPFDFDPVLQQLSSLPAALVVVFVLMLFLALKIKDKHQLLAEWVCSFAFLALFCPLLVLVAGLPKDSGVYEGFLALGFLTFLIGICNGMSVLCFYFAKQIEKNLNEVWGKIF